IAGIHSSCVYGGTPNTVFCWHVEDYHLYSPNSQIDGASKVWYIVPSKYIQNFLHYPQDILKFKDTIAIPLRCQQFLRHQAVINAEQELSLDKKFCKEYHYKCYKYTHNKGDMIITWPGVYHSDIITGWNLNEAGNFGTSNWLKEAKEYQPSECIGDPVLEINLEEFETNDQLGQNWKYQLGLVDSRNNTSKYLIS
ncbi:JmjC domain, hydroxylase-domain-containing protein, partial [Trichophaea hybrida]